MFPDYFVETALASKSKLSAITQHNKVNKMILTFEEWLTNQQYREDLVGNLARDPKMQNVEHKSSRRKPDEHKSFADIVTRTDEPGRITVFNEAWQEFLLAKLAAKGPLD